MAQSVAGGVLGFIIVAIVVGVLGVMLVFLWIKHKYVIIIGHSRTSE